VAGAASVTTSRDIDISGPVTINVSDQGDPHNAAVAANNNGVPSQMTANGPIGNGANGTGSLIKSGVGTLTLASSQNTYSGGTTVSNGTLLVTSTLGSGTGSGAVTVKSGGKLGGTGIISGAVTNEAGGTLAPGASIGTLTVNNTVTLAGATVMEINPTNSPNSDRLVATSIVGGGTLMVTNIGTTNFTAGDTFTLFSQPVSGFSSVTLPPLNGSLIWTTNTLAINGTISVISGIATNPTNITATVSGSTLTLSWPADHLGWILQSQTNSLDLGLFTNWVDVTGSADSNTNIITVNPDEPTVFYRLRNP